MKYKVQTLPNFEREAKTLLKKYPSLRNELIDLYSVLEAKPTSGISLGKNCYKIRLSISSKGKGKSGGARVITCFVVDRDCVYLLSIYDKSEQSNFTPQQLQIWIDNI